MAYNEFSSKVTASEKSEIIIGQSNLRIFIFQGHFPSSQYWLRPYEKSYSEGYLALFDGPFSAESQSKTATITITSTSRHVSSPI